MDKTFFSAKSNQETPPSVIHGWKATDLLLMMVKRKIYFRNPISRQNFANAFAETPNLNLEVCRMVSHGIVLYLTVLHGIALLGSARGLYLARHLSTLLRYFSQNSIM